MERGSIDWSGVLPGDIRKDSLGRKGQRRRRLVDPLEGSVPRPSLPAPHFPAAIHDAAGIRGALEASYGDGNGFSGDEPFDVEKMIQVLIHGFGMGEGGWRDAIAVTSFFFHSVFLYWRKFSASAAQVFFTSCGSIDHSLK
jgi:hypothetical protein